jgi:TP901 family phage tail tape measure protein
MSFIGELTGRIVLDVSQAVKSYGEVRRNHRALIEDGRQLGISFQNSGRTMAAAGGIIIGGLAKASLVAGEFNKKMAYFGAVTNTNEKQMAKLRDATIKWAADSLYSTNEVADGVVELGKAGVSSETLINGLGQAIINLGQAADIGMQEASQIMVSTMSQFELKAQDAVAVADRLSGTANASIIDMKDLGVTMKYAGGVAHALGGNLDDVTTAIALLGNAGIKGSQAGTSLRQMMVSLNGSTKPAIAAMKELGIITAEGQNQFFDLQGNIKPLPQVFQVLQDSLKGYSKQQQTAYLRTIFNNRALTAAAILTKEGASGFKEMNGEIAKTNAADVAAKRLNNLSSKLEILRGNFEATQMQTGQAFQTFLTTLVDSLTKLLQAFNNLPKGMQTATVWTIALGGAFLLTAGLGLMFMGFLINMIVNIFRLRDAMIVLRAAMAAGEMGKLGTVLSFIGRALLSPIKLIGLLAGAIWGAVTATWAWTVALLANPITWVVLAVVALIAVFVLLYTKSETVRKALDSLWGSIVSGAAAAWAWLQKLPAAIGGFFASLGPKLLAGITSAFATLGSWFAQLPGIIASGLAAIPGLVAKFIGFIIGWLIKLPVLALVGILGLVTVIVNGLASLLPQLAGWAGYALGFILGFFARMIIQAVIGIYNFGQALITGLFNLLTAIMVWGIQAGIAFVQWLVNLPAMVVTFLTNVSTAFFNWLLSLIAWVVANAPKIGQAIIDGIQALPGLVMDIISQLPGIIAGLISSAVSAAIKFGQGVFDSISDIVTGLPDLLTGAIQDAIAAFTSLGHSAWKAAQNFADKMWQGFKDGLGIASPSYIEHALWAITDTAAEETKRLRSQVIGIQKVSKKISDIAISPSTDFSSMYDLAASMKANDNLVASYQTQATLAPNSISTLIDANQEDKKNSSTQLIGTLDLTSRSSAVIKGMAAEVVDSDEDFEKVVARMEGK